MKTVERTRLPQTPKNDRKYDTLCVCQICTCGKHHCPPAGHRPFQGETTYNHDYKPCNGIIQQLQRPCTNHYHERHYDPAVLKTSYDTQYTPYKIENQPYDGANKYQYRPRTGKFHDETQYNKNYQPKPLTAERPKDCCHRYTPKTTKFEGTTTYNAEFSPKKADNAFTPKNYAYQRRKVPFQGKTTYNTQFKSHEIQPTSTWCNGCNNCGNGCRCKYVPQRRGRFEGESDYKASYKPYEIQRNGHCPILDLPNYPRECSPGKTHVNYSAEKKRWQ